MTFRFIYSNFELSRIIQSVLIDKRASIPEIKNKIGADIKIFIESQVQLFSENDVFYNRLIWVKPDGKIFTYDKKHLFRMGGEDKVYTPGGTHLTVDLKGWRIRPFICYDLRFPVWSRNSGMEYDLAVYSANWPAARDFHWEILLRARAIENLCYVAGVNRTGHDRNKISYNGKSSVIDYYGNVMYCTDINESVKTIELSYADLSAYRESFPAWMDSDRFELI